MLSYHQATVAVWTSAILVVDVLGAGCGDRTGSWSLGRAGSVLRAQRGSASTATSFSMLLFVVLSCFVFLD